jgi:hypothetical protein
VFHVTFLCDLRLDPRSAADLRWYFCDAAGEMGLRSNFGAMVAGLEAGGRRGGAPMKDMDPRVIAAATRARRITRVLEHLAAAHLLTLARVYGSSEHPGLESFGTLGSLFPETQAAHRAHVVSQSRKPFETWLFRRAQRVSAGKGSRAEQAFIIEVSREAEAMLAAASRAYLRKRAVN